MKNRVKSYREELGLTQQEYADEIGVSRKTLSDIENEKQDPSLEVAFKIASYHHGFIEDVFKSKYKTHSLMEFNIEEQRKKIFNKWLQELVENWKKKNISNIMNLFADKCEYYESPFEKLENWNAINDVWQEINNQKIKNVGYQILCATENRCVARVILEEKNGTIIDMIYLFELNHEDKCSRFMQWYNINV